MNFVTDTSSQYIYLCMFKRWHTKKFTVSQVLPNVILFHISEYILLTLQHGLLNKICIRNIYSITQFSINWQVNTKALKILFLYKPINLIINTSSQYLYLCIFNKWQTKNFSVLKYNLLLFLFHITENILLTIPHRSLYKFCIRNIYIITTFSFIWLVCAKVFTKYYLCTYVFSTDDTKKTSHGST